MKKTKKSQKPSYQVIVFRRAIPTLLTLTVADNLNHKEALKLMKVLDNVFADLPAMGVKIEGD